MVHFPEMNESYKELNKNAWDWESSHGNIWTDGVGDEAVKAAKEGKATLFLSPFHQMDPDWVRPYLGGKVLCLAGGGGQQGILLSALGCDVTVFDLSPSQLAMDRKLADKHGLSLTTEEGDMEDLSRFPDDSFSLIVNPCSTCFVPDVEKVYRECARILVPGGALLTVATNPAMYMFDEKRLLKGKVKVRYTIPYSDMESLGEKEKERMTRIHDTFEYSHTVDSLVGGLCRAGFSIQDFTTDQSGNEAADSFLHDCFFAIKAVRL